MKRSKRKTRHAVDALTLLIRLNGAALKMHRELSADGFTLTRNVRVCRRKDGSYSARFVWRQREPAKRAGGTVVNTAFTVSWTEVFEVVG